MTLSVHIENNRLDIAFIIFPFLTEPFEFPHHEGRILGIGRVDFKQVSRLQQMDDKFIQRVKLKKK